MSDHPLQLKKKFFSVGPLLVILDTYPAHRSSEARAIVEFCSSSSDLAHQAALVRVSPWIGKYSECETCMLERVGGRAITRKAKKVTWEMVVVRFVAAWNRVTQDSIESAWGIFEESCRG
jgi:hypothetical protein